ncbi:MAG: hypothetical protein QM203_04790 [Bacillota bacterium]|jgi:predicted small lipoprotein YifL|nr:hypothetical protein [Bacillota bacterium]
MKKNSKIFATLLFISSVFVSLAGCGKRTPSESETPTDPGTEPEPPVVETVSLINGWQDNLDSVYDPVVTDGVLHMNFDKAGATWATAKKGLGAVAADLEGMTTLGLDLRMDGYTEVGPMLFILKIEFNDAANNPAREVKFQASATQTTYEWDVSAFDLTDALQMLMFIDPGSGTTKGDAVFTTFAFAKTHAVENPVIIGTPVEVVKNVYESGDTFDVNKNFYDGGDFSYRITTEAGVTTVDYVKYGLEWPNMYNISTGVEGFNFFNVKIQGPADKQALLKLEGGEGLALEAMVTFDGTEQELTLEFAKKQTKTGDQFFRLFAEPGLNTISDGQIKITLLEFSNVALVPIVDYNNYYNGMNPWDKEWNLDTFVDGGDNLFTVTGREVTWENAATGWSTVKMLLAGKEHGFFTKFEATLTAKQAMKVIVKVGAPLNLEQTLDFTTDALTQTAVIDMTGRTYQDINAVTEVLMFPLFDAATPTTGGLTIDTAKFTTPKAAAVNENMIDALYGPTAYNFTYDGTKTTIQWDAKGEWDAFGLALDPTVDYTAVTTVEVAVESDTIAQLKVKLNDAQEYDLDLTADGPQTLTLTVTTPIDAAAKPFVIFFPDGGQSAAGNLVITSLKLM